MGRMGGGLYFLVEIELKIKKKSHLLQTLRWSSTVVFSIQWSILVICSILNYTSVLNAHLTNESLPASRTASKHSLQAGVPIILGFSKENNALLKYIMPTRMTLA